MLWVFDPITYSYLWFDTQIMVLNPRLHKLHTDSLVVFHGVVFFKTRPFVKRNSTEFTNVSSFTLLHMCSTHFTLSCRILFFFLPTSNNFFKFVYSEILESLPCRSCLGPLGVASSLAIEGHQNWTHFDSGLLISRTFIPLAGSSFTSLFYLYLVSCTQKMC